MMIPATTFPIDLPEGIDAEELKALVPADMWEKDATEAAILALRRSGKFDEDAYLNAYPDVKESGMGAIEHYVRFGAGEGRIPYHIYRKKQIKNVNNKSKIRRCKISYLLSQLFGVEHVYVINLESQRDRLIRFFREMNRNEIKTTPILGIDGNSIVAQDKLLRFHQRSIAVPCTSTRHIPKEKRQFWKKELTSGVFGYLLSQQQIFEDAIQQGYKRILIFDDDVFFHSRAEDLLYEVYCCIPKDYKVIALGTSEYIDKNSSYFELYSKLNTCNLYHPIPGYTCGSFAIIYDQSIYKEILTYIHEGDGPFDNATLGTVYLNHRSKCFAVDPAICIPDVVGSSLRKERDQYHQSVKMNWEMTRYTEFMKFLTISVFINNFECIQNYEEFQNGIKSNISIKFFYKTPNEFCAIKTGSAFLDDRLRHVTFDTSISTRDVFDFLPHSDIIMIWPKGKHVTVDGVLSVFSQAMLAQNKHANQSGEIDDVIYSLDCGMILSSGEEPLNLLASE